MKRIIHLSGIFFLVILLTGIILKRYHLPGAGVASVLGIFLFVAVYLPWFLVSWIKQLKKEGRGRAVSLLYFALPALVVLTFGVLAKIMHWPGASFGLWGGIGFIMTVLLINLIVTPVLSNRIPMVWILIIIMIFGSFSFNTIRFGNTRSLKDAEKITLASFSEASRIFKSESQSLIIKLNSQNYGTDSTAYYKEASAIHMLVSGADSILTELFVRISRVPEEGIIDSMGHTLKAWDLYNYYLTEPQGLPLLKKYFSEITDYYSSSPSISAEQKGKLEDVLRYPYKDLYGESLPGEFGIHEYEMTGILNFLNLWKLKLWETQYQYLSFLQ